MGRSSVGGAGHILYRMIPMHRGDSNAIVRGNLLSQARTTCKQQPQRVGFTSKSCVQDPWLLT